MSLPIASKVTCSCYGREVSRKNRTKYVCFGHSRVTILKTPNGPVVKCYYCGRIVAVPKRQIPGRRR